MSNYGWEGRVTLRILVAVRGVRQKHADPEEFAAILREAVKTDLRFRGIESILLGDIEESHEDAPGPEDAPFRATGSP